MVRALSGGLSGLSLVAVLLPVVVVTSCNDEFSDGATTVTGPMLLSGFDAATPKGPTGDVTHVPGTWLIALMVGALAAGAVICLWRALTAVVVTGVLGAVALAAFEGAISHVSDRLATNTKIHVSHQFAGLAVDLTLLLVIFLGVAAALGHVAPSVRRALGGRPPRSPWGPSTGVPGWPGPPPRPPS